MSENCTFCKIVNGSIPSERLHENAEFICIRDIQPQAPIHLLVLPKKHVISLEDVYSSEQAGEAALIGRLFQFAVTIARKERLLPDGFRSVINTNKNGGQTVFHLHLHLLGGEPLQGTFA